MRKLDIATAITASLMALAITGCSSSNENTSDTAQNTATCDRECLIEITNQYLSALAAKNPSSAPLAENMVFVENTQRLRPGEGLWATTTGGPTSFAIHVPDPQLQQAGWMGVIEQDGKPVLLAVRLKLDDNQITEVEHLITEPAQGSMEHLQAVRPGLLKNVPEDQRLSHDELIRIGATYYDALDDNDGSKMQFAPDCQRIENGMVTAGKGMARAPNMPDDQPRLPTDCTGQIDSQAFTYIDKIDNRRMIAADPVTGLVMGLSHFRQPMDNLPYKVTNADGSIGERNAENMPFEPFDMPAAHIFKIDDEGAVHEIEAVGVKLPYNSATGWE